MSVIFQAPANPWEWVPLEDWELLAIKALAAGNASPRQQEIALYVIMFKFAFVDDQTFRPGPDSRASDFAAGKRDVGLRIRAAINRVMPATQPEKTDARSPERTGSQSAAARINPKPPARVRRKRPAPG